MAHIEGTAPNEREAHESAEEEAADAGKKSAKQGSLSKSGKDPNRTSSHFVGDNDSVENDKKS